MRRVVMLLTAAVVLGAPGAAAAPTRVTLLLSGYATSSTHGGTFTAGAPLCAHGTWSQTDTAVPERRTFTCEDGSGTFAANFNPNVDASPRANQPWAIVGGTGSYAKLRGLGTAALETTPVWRDTWTGLVDFDDVAPRATTLKARAAVSGRALSVTGAFAARDNVAGNAVRYGLGACVGTAHCIGPRRGTVAKGKVVRFRLAGGLSPGTLKTLARTRHVTVDLFLSDPLANTRETKKSVRVGRR